MRMRPHCSSEHASNLKPNLELTPTAGIVAISDVIIVNESVVPWMLGEPATGTMYP
jgi:hypothetical protein